MTKAQRYAAPAREPGHVSLGETVDDIHRAFSEFLTLPTAIIFCALCFAIGSYALDRAELPALAPVTAFFRAHVFASPRATSDLLSAIAAGLIAVTSLTITLLLIVVQESASTMTAEVFDQFLRRRSNQAYFGFFIGLALFTLVTLATVNDPFNPVFGGALALAGTIVALYLLAVLLYTTINQMRPVEIIEAIHNHTLHARRRHLDLVQRTRRVSSFEGAATVTVTSSRHGFVTTIHAAALGEACASLPGETEVRLAVRLGTFVGTGDVLGTVTAANDAAACELGEALSRSIHLERQRAIMRDPGCGVEQLVTIGWTSVSSAQSKPGAGQLVIHSLRDLLACWSVETAQAVEQPASLPIVYDDDLVERLFDGFESLAVASWDSRQHQSYVQILQALTGLLPRLAREHADRAEDVLMRMLSVLGAHAPTSRLDQSLLDAAAALRSDGRPKAAEAFASAREQLMASVGRFVDR